MYMYCTVNGKGCCRFCRDDAASPGTLIVAGLARRSAHRSGPHHSSGKDSGQNGDRKLQTNSLARQSKLRGVALHRRQGRAGAARSNVPNARQRLQNKCNINLSGCKALPIQCICPQQGLDKHKRRRATRLAGWSGT